MTLYFHTKPEKDKRRYTFAGIIEGKTIRVGLALCSPKDNFQKRLGRTIAEGRAKKNPLIILNDPEITEFPIKTFLDYVKDFSKYIP